ncbi:Polyisoprenoid-binding protein YceI [Rathayibacter oskolensis]|uniref:Polyisoprenoid-binding protein YceI n=1 Tax=Rathayibacter oskolensis TaxID=1891671 RepID=A0A1X7NK02_9MICO|nr:YceI family protein [Rathayibacter oskolensis]SMH38237.1 Polyisoprenoid-binding protein YceI [Rathayibacter oskolensis]
MTQPGPPAHRIDRDGTVERYRLLPAATTVLFRTRHLFGLGEVAGTVQLASGGVDVVAGTRELLSLEAELDMRTFDSGSRARDRAVAKRNVLDVENHPRALYRSTAADRTADGWLVHGSLTVKGIAAPVDLVVADLDPDAVLEARATAALDRFAYGIAFPAFLADRALSISILARAERVPSRAGSAS